MLSAADSSTEIGCPFGYNSVAKTSWSVFVLAGLALSSCKHVDYAQRARTPLMEMRSVSKGKSKDYDVPPRVLNGFRPDYPADEANRRESGFAVIICTVGADGKAHDFAVEQMSSPAFAYEAAKAIEKWTWSPARKDGKPIPQKVRVPMYFNGA